MSSGPTPVLHVIAGPNGAGKSTFADRFLLPAMPGIPFVNADLIERAARDGGEELDSYVASGRAADIRDRLTGARRSFVFETVFSHPSKVDVLQQASEAGYLTTLHVLIVPADLSVARVALRVKQGGHPVPEDKIRSRHARLWGLVAEALQVVDTGLVYNSSRGTPKVVAEYYHGHLVGEPNWPAWSPSELDPG